MTCLPPIGSRVRTTAGDVGTVKAHSDWFVDMATEIHGPGARVSPEAFVAGMWVTADEIEEVLP